MLLALLPWAGGALAAEAGDDVTPAAAKRCEFRQCPVA